MGKTTESIKLEPVTKRIGHQPHRSGAGTHHDSRTGRQRTRQDQRRQAIKEYDH